MLPLLIALSEKKEKDMQASALFSKFQGFLIVIPASLNFSLIIFLVLLS